VFAGTFNMSGVLDVSVSRTGRDTTLGKVRELILAAERTKPRFMRMIDRYAHYYTPLVLLMAFFIWAVNGHQMDPVVAVLVAACPIALVLSTPSAAVAALSAGARLGILIKNIGDIEVLSSITSFIFDKTGTLTTGNLDVVEIAPVDGVEAAELVRIAAGIESGSNHPVAKAVCRFAEKVRVPRAESDEIREVAGKGLLGNVDGSRIIVGNRIWLEENGIPASQFPDFGDEVNHGLSLLFVARDGLALGWISLGDSIREDAAECMDSIRREGIGNLGIVTGDRAGVAAHVAEELKIPLCWGECKPTEKVERIRQIKSHGHRTAFVGDGVNDAPALAASDIGIAMGAAGSDLAVETATIALMNNKLNRLPFLLRLAKDYRRIMIQNFVLGAVFIVLGVTAGAVGYLTAVPAACVQVASAILIVMNSARLVRSGESIR
jgi:Cd2+/Zn2+-exporting ATPase